MTIGVGGSWLTQKPTFWYAWSMGKLVPLALVVAFVLVALFANACERGRVKEGRGSKLTLFLARILLLVPAAWLALFMVLVLRARWILGYWPQARTGNIFDGTYSYPLDPKVMSMHASFVWFGALATVILILAGPFLSALALRWHGRKAWSQVGVFALSVVGCTVLWTADPGGYWTWFLD